MKDPVAVATNPAPPADPGGGAQATTPSPGAPEMETLQVNEQTGFKVEKGFKLPEVISTSINEKDRTIAQQKQELESVKQGQTKQIEELGRVLTQGTNQQQNQIPDPIDDPEGHREAIRAEGRAEGQKAAKEYMGTLMESVGETQLFQKLAAGDQKAYDNLIAKAVDLGLAEFRDEMWHFQKNAATLTHAFINRAKDMQTAENKGAQTVQDDLTRAGQAAGSATGTAQAATGKYGGYSSMAEFKAKDPVGYEKMKETADKEEIPGKSSTFLT